METVDFASYIYIYIYIYIHLTAVFDNVVGYTVWWHCETVLYIIRYWRMVLWSHYWTTLLDNAKRQYHEPVLAVFYVTLWWTTLNVTGQCSVVCWDRVIGQYFGRVFVVLIQQFQRTSWVCAVAVITRQLSVTLPFYCINLTFCVRAICNNIT